MSEKALIIRRSPRPIVIRRSGVPGPAGAGNASAPFTFVQASASALWTVNHNLGWTPLVELLTAGGQVLDALITHISVNQFTVTFNAPTAGRALAR